MAGERLSLQAWIPRDFDAAAVASRALPIKVLKGPRQVGKTSVLERLGTHQVVYLDDAAIRGRARENPRLFLDSLPAKLVLDEAALAPELFSELKRRVDEDRRLLRSGRQPVREPLDVWVTGSNQTPGSSRQTAFFAGSSPRQPTSTSG